jgi:hypothetical protein
MKLNKNDRIKYDESIYIVVAVVWNTVYLQKVNDDGKEYRFTMEQLYKNGFKDIEIIKNDKENN